jgi:hypothetical protein
VLQLAFRLRIGGKDYEIFRVPIGGVIAIPDRLTLKGMSDFGSDNPRDLTAKGFFMRQQPPIKVVKEI